MAFPSPALSASCNHHEYRRRQNVEQAPCPLDVSIGHSGSRYPPLGSSLGISDRFQRALPPRREQHSSSLQYFPSTSRLDQYSAGLYIAYQAIGSAFSAWSRESLAGSLSCACHVGAKVGSDRSGLWRVERVSDGLRLIRLRRLRPLT